MRTANTVGEGEAWGGSRRVEHRPAAIPRYPICVILIVAVLYVALRSAVLAPIVFTAVPLAIAGGVFTLALRGMPFSISAGVGFIAVFGVAVLNGLVVMGSTRRKLETEADIEVQKPWATVVIGGLITSTALTLLVLPGVYRGAFRTLERNPATEAVPVAAEPDSGARHADRTEP